MKTIPFSALFALLTVAATMLLGSCIGVSKEQYKQASDSADSLMQLALQQSNEIYDLSTTLKAVSEQLDKINGQLSLEGNNDETLQDRREQILSRLTLLQQNMEQKQEELETLKKHFNDQLKGNELLQKTVERLQNQVKDYEKTIETYKQQVAEQEARIAQLADTLMETRHALKEAEQQTEVQKQVIGQQDEMLNTGYYLAASKERLMDLGILEGGFFSHKRLTTQGFSSDDFTKVDIRHLDALTIHASRAELMTSHPARSYTLRSTGNNTLTLTITDAASFWSNSRYLVIKTK